MLTQLKSAVQNLAQERSTEPEVISYHTLRNAIGWLGSMLPVSLIAGSFLFGPCDVIQPSISHYYYTNMREVFVGLMCAVSLFLFSYRGHSRLDSMVSNLAGLFSLGVALFPTNVIENYHCQHEVASFIAIPIHNIIHFSCAGLFFFTLSMMSLLLFTKSNKQKEEQTDEKRIRNTVYKVCGVIMLISIVIIAISKPLLHVDDKSQITFWFETVALVAFGISWLTKGELLFGDRPSQTAARP